MRIFSLAALVAYVFGMIFAYEPFINANSNGFKALVSFFGFPPVTNTSPVVEFYLTHVLGALVLLVIGLRFYLHAEKIAPINAFFDSLSRSQRCLEALLRAVWVLFALNLPNIIAMQVFLRKTPTDNLLLGVFFFVTLFLMYLAMVIWCGRYLDKLITAAPHKGITRDNAWCLIYPDFAVLISAFFAAVAAGILSWNDKSEVIHVVFAVVFVVILVAILFQLIFFFFDAVFNFLANLLKQKRNNEILH